MAGRTDVGRTREHNEDAFLVADLSTGLAVLEPELREHILGSRGTVFMVADGLGGAVSGEIASSMAVEVVLDEMRSRWSNAASEDGAAFAGALKAATEAANDALHEFAERHPEHRGMGTTATIAGLLGDTLYLVQVGDSRAYLVRDGVAQQITKDQSLMQRLIEAGELTPEEAEHSERRNIILQALGPEPNVKIDLTHQPVRRGDTLVLCTDGLSGLVKKEEIAAILAEEPDLDSACQRLIDRANENGGPDNITVVIAHFEGDGLRSASVDDRVGHTVFSLGAGTTPTGTHGVRGIRRSMGAAAARRPAAGEARALPWLLRGNMPYVIAAVIAVLVGILAVASRLRVDVSPTRAPAPVDSAAAPAPASRTPASS
ncbi:MAG TPA: Stp1/IreP family PP2C-type Ser/Thr phosphatase [Gemmatimonadaceae bacterium]|nr:Stp1/IreP family PP2C-type Ser/Thr phosphatase [Gemmatimonadaceae bacterium]